MAIDNGYASNFGRQEEILFKYLQVGIGFVSSNIKNTICMIILVNIRLFYHNKF